MLTLEQAVTIQILHQQETSCESKNHLNINFMRYQKLNRFSDSEFKRLVGVPRHVFTEMVEVLEKAESLKKKSGRPHTLDIEDQLLLTLNYLRNYSTQLELAANYHIAESNVNRTIKKVEDALMKSRRFTLPKRSITTADEHFNWVIIDATECGVCQHSCHPYLNQATKTSVGLIRLEPVHD